MASLNINSHLLSFPNLLFRRVLLVKSGILQFTWLPNREVHRERWQFEGTKYIEGREK